MSGYVITLIGTVIVCSLAAMLAPEENGMLGYVKLAAGLCILCVAISPITSFVETVDGLFESDGFFGNVGGAEEDLSDIYENGLLGASQTSVSQGLRDMICREFELKRDEIEVSVKLREDEQTCVAEGVTVVFVGGRAIITDPHEVIAYVGSVLGCRCEIIYA